jgi:SRSO17 transposase
MCRVQDNVLGHAFIDRALYLPKAWTGDPARMAAAHVPSDVMFATKPTLARLMIERAVKADVPFRWVAANRVYGVGEIEMALKRVVKGYVLGVSADHGFNSFGKARCFGGTAATITEGLDASDWKRLSAGHGTKGPRLHDWACMTGPIWNWPILRRARLARTRQTYGHAGC